MQELLQKLNHSDVNERLSALSALCKAESYTPTADVNNHIHTFYSFSPYSPSAAVYYARQAGLSTAGIMDHDSVSGLSEFRKAGSIAGLPVTCGLEIRVSLADSPFYNRRVNNPDQDGVAYVALHSLPKAGEGAVAKALEKVSAARGERNRAMSKRLNEIIAPLEIAISYEDDIVPLSKASEGGSVTERHILFALSLKLMEKFGKGEKLLAALARLNLPISEKNRRWLSDVENPHYAYDLLGALKGELVASFYIDAKDELLSAKEAVALAKASGAIIAYAYLGDVTDSVTGDKRQQAFEDAYLDELVAYLHETGFQAVTYMPSRNTKAQLDRLRKLCEKAGLLQISGEDINSPRQGFICHAARAPEFANLTDAAWALIGSEKAAEQDVSKAMFGPEDNLLRPELSAKVAYYKNLAR